MAKFCSQCGAPLQGGKFCTLCGTPIPQENDQIKNEPQPIREHSGTQQPYNSQSQPLNSERRNEKTAGHEPRMKNVGSGAPMKKKHSTENTSIHGQPESSQMPEYPMPDMGQIRPIAQWSPDDGDALWWSFPISDYPYQGKPTDQTWPGNHLTHWTPLASTQRATEPSWYDYDAAEGEAGTQPAEHTGPSDDATQPWKNEQPAGHVQQEAEPNTRKEPSAAARLYYEAGNNTAYEEALLSSVAEEGSTKILAALSYVGILFCVPIAVKKDNRFCRFHAKQGINLFTVFLGLMVLRYILGIISDVMHIIPIVGRLVSIAGTLLMGAAGIFYFAFALMGIFNAVSGKAKPLPLVSALPVGDKILPDDEMDDNVTDTKIRPGTMQAENENLIKRIHVLMDERNAVTEAFKKVASQQGVVCRYCSSRNTCKYATYGRGCDNFLFDFKTKQNT